MPKTDDENVVIVGNSLEPTAYHEAGHIVAATVAGLTLRPAGITIYEITETVTSGFAAFWKANVDGTPLNVLQREGMMVALLAGINAQLKISSESTAGGGDDIDECAKLLNEHYPHDQHMQDRINERVQALLREHWNAIVAIATAVMQVPWTRVKDAEFPEANRKKQLAADAIVIILGRFGITAIVQ